MEDRQAMSQSVQPRPLRRAAHKPKISPVSIALFSLMGIVVGAILQYWVTRFLEDRKHYRLLQAEAYGDYLQAVAAAAHLSLATSEADRLAQLANAKTRICLYGAKEVVGLLAEFERAGGVIGSEQQRKAFVRLVQAMRVDSNSQSTDVEDILLGDGSSRP